MILLKIDPAWLTLGLIALSAMWVAIGYLLGYRDAEDGVLEAFEEPRE